jgi:AraC-like DNA-binding protein
MGVKVSWLAGARIATAARCRASALWRGEGSDDSRLRSTSEAEAGGFFEFKECQDLLKERLTEPLLRLFAELSGVQLHPIWRHPPDFGRSSELPVLCPKAYRRLEQTNEVPTACRTCLQQRWRVAVFATDDACRFVGLCRISNLCVSLEMAGTQLLTLVAQAQVADRDSQPSEETRTCRRSLRNSGGAEASIPFAVVHGLEHAEALLLLILHDLQATVYSHIAKAELQQAHRRLLHLEAEDSRLRKELHNRFPEISESLPIPASASHAQQIVVKMLDYARRHYQRPMSLREVSSSLNMNASYLSGLFSKTMGVTFHHYLDELRLAKAEELLRDPCARVREIAYAVGYVSPNHFRNVFKVHEGIPPSAWRDMTQPPDRESSR